MAIVHLFGEMDLPYAGQDRDKAFTTASYIAEQVGYFVRKRAENQLELRGFDTDEYLLVHYNNDDITFKMSYRSNPKHKNRSNIPVIS